MATVNTGLLSHQTSIINTIEIPLGGRVERVRKIEITNGKIYAELQEYYFGIIKMQRHKLMINFAYFFCIVCLVLHNFDLKS